MPTKYGWLAWLAVANSALAAAVFVLCYYIGKSGNHFPSWMNFPSPSYLTVKSPERYIYGVGFTIVSFNFLVTLWPFVQILQSRIEREYAQGVKSIVVISIVGFICILVQAVVPLQSNIFQKLDADDSSQNFQSLVHQTAASVFLLASWLLITMILYFTNYSPRLLAFYSKVWWNVKAMCLIIPGLTMLFGLFYQVDATDPHPLRKSINASGFSQFACVACVVVFYGTFYHDYRVIDNVLNENPATVGVSAGGEDDGIEMQMRARSLVDHPGRSAAEDVEEGTGDEHESRGLLATE